ncbi:unnamed protein product [Clonostachys chloroleuca]|uniref:Uncharacterized protein n=1 Tax=Clonostachys chloroleuca TaxID=1926264 RepID=A0AA35LR48_9HYPO|nr:unnamed protein product [Clonostachys chloroleuca]
MEASQPNAALSAAYVDSLVTHLDFTNTPKGLAKAYQDALKAEETSTERILLANGGFSVWFAYFLTKRAAKSATHFDGQAACSQMLEALDEISIENRTLLAHKVQEAIPTTTQAKFQDVFDKTIKPIGAELTPRKRRRTTDDNGGQLTIPAPNPVALVNNAHMSSHFELGNPPVLRIATVFPRFVAGAIAIMKSDEGAWTAAITMSFLDASSFGNKLGCMMSLQITSNKIERLASELFDAHIEATGEHRYLVLPNGLRVIPSPDFTLRGCRRHVISQSLGQDIEKAVKTSQAFKEEAEQGNPLTECVTMTISHRAEDGAVINLSLDEKEGVRIRRKLYE